MIYVMVDAIVVIIRTTSPQNVTLETDLGPHNISNTWTSHTQTHTHIHTHRVMTGHKWVSNLHRAWSVITESCKWTRVITCSLFHCTFFELSHTHTHTRTHTHIVLLLCLSRLIFLAVYSLRDRCPPKESTTYLIFSVCGRLNDRSQVRPRESQ